MTDQAHAVREEVGVGRDRRRFQRGFIKLEDTIAVTADGYELMGARGRGWNIGG